MKLFTETNGIVEVAFTAAHRYADPYNDVDLDVVFTADGGASMSVPAFWAGDHTWKVRFSPPTPGEYSFKSVCSRLMDDGLHGREGTVSVTAYCGTNALRNRGRLRVASSRAHFEHADGTPFFWLGDTWWMGLSTRLDWPHGFQYLAADRVAKGFNVVQIIAGPYPDMDAWDVRGRNEAGYPFEKEFDRINPAYYDLADLKIAHLVSRGLMPCIVGMWGYYLEEIGVDRVKRFWRNLIARYAAYPVTWCICGECTMTYYLATDRERLRAFQKQGWTEVMRCVRETDPYHNLITVHPTRFGRTQVEDPTLMDFEMLQTGHGDLESVQHTEEMVAMSVPKDPKMPVVVGEVNYESILGRAWQNVQRLCFYKAVLNGTAGHTYGANGIWQLNEPGKPYGPSPHGRSWGNMPWNEAMHLPGSTQAGHLRRFIERFEWWRLESHPEWLTPQPGKPEPYSIVCVGIPGALRIVYVPMMWDTPKVTAMEPGVSYKAYYYDPRSGDDVDLGSVTPDGEGVWQPPFAPEVSDWLLVLKAE